MDKPRLVIITGMSGAGKTQVMRFMEDLGYFCVDNLPPALIPKFAELCEQSGGRVTKIALVVDIRGGEFFDQLMQVLGEMDQQDMMTEVLFLEASDETIIHRYKETRRRHPLAPAGRVSEGIRLERDKLEYVRGRATHIIDTSNLKTQQLKDRIIELYASDGEQAKLHINVVSFGFKYGIPLDADMVFDVRFLRRDEHVEFDDPLRHFRAKHLFDLNRFRTGNRAAAGDFRAIDGRNPRRRRHGRVCRCSRTGTLSFLLFTHSLSPLCRRIPSGD